MVCIFCFVVVYVCMYDQMGGSAWLGWSLSHLTRVFQARYARSTAGRRPPTPCPVRAETGTTGREPSCASCWGGCLDGCWHL